MTVSAPKTTRSTILIVLGIGALFVCCTTGLMAAIAVPSFLRFQQRAKQTEAKINLKSIFTSQRALYAENDAYSVDVNEVGAVPGTRFTCFLSPSSAMSPSSAPTLAFERLQVGVDSVPGIAGTCPDCQFTAVCAGNIDSDDTLDIWSISSADRLCGKAGVPCNDVNDVEQ